MAVTVLEIVDSAVKIGLGAAISGAATYLVSRRQQRAELQKEVLAIRVNLLKECAFKLIESSSLRNHSELQLQHWRLGKSSISPEQIEEQLTAMLKSYNLLKEARSIASLVGRHELSELFGRYQSLVSEKHDHYLVRRLQYDVAFINSRTDQSTELSAQILSKLSDSFESKDA